MSRADDPYAAFITSEAFAPLTEENVRRDERDATRRLGCVPCPVDHGGAQTRYTFGPRTGEMDVAPAFDGPCPGCGAVL